MRGVQANPAFPPSGKAANLPRSSRTELILSLLNTANHKHGDHLAATFLCGDFNIKAGSEGYQAVVRTCEYEDQYLAATSSNWFEKIFRQQSPNIDRHFAEDGRIDFIFMLLPRLAFRLTIGGGISPSWMGRRSGRR